MNDYAFPRPIVFFGGPQSPEEIRDGLQALGDHLGGLTKREWFAGQALAGHLAGSEPSVEWAGFRGPEQLAAACCAAADALLAELAKGKAPS